MATDMFLKLGDIKGESRDQTHRDEIDIANWAWGLSQEGSMHAGTGGGAGKVSVANLNLKKALDKSSPNLMMACASGKHYPEARLVVRKAGGPSAVEYLIITLKEVLDGKKVNLDIPHTVVCEPCKGTGGKDGKVTTCSRCGGSGQIQTVRQSMFGQMVSIEDCPECRGRGRTSAERCPHCRGTGRVNKDAHIDLNIPKGMEEGMRLRVAGAGNAGYNGGPAGDLFVVIHIKQDKVFDRDGANLWTGITTSYPKLVLGGEEVVTTLEGDKVQLRIPAGTDVGTVLRIPGKGLPRTNSSSRGDLMVRVAVNVPKRVSDEERELLTKLDSSAGSKGKKGRKGLKGKIQDTIDDLTN